MVEDMVPLPVGNKLKNTTLPKASCTASMNLTKQTSGFKHAKQS